MEENSITENDSCRTENVGDLPCDITEKKTSVCARSFFHVIADCVSNSTLAKVFSGVKNNFVSPNSIPDVKAKQHNAALGAVLKQEASGNDTRVRSVNSLVSTIYFGNHSVLYTQPLKKELTEGSETSANHNLTPGKYPKEYIELT
jgi:hypothetical protein